MSVTLRLFFAIPCPATLATELGHWRDGLGLAGRPVPMENFHVTLAFLGGHPPDHLPLLADIGARLDGAAFSLAFTTLERWRSGALVLTSDSPPAALMSLAETLRHHLAEAGLPGEGRPYRPHLTLMRDAAPLPQPLPVDYALTADRVGLYRSDSTSQGVRYHAVQSWPLTAS